MKLRSSKRPVIRQPLLEQPETVFVELAKELACSEYLVRLVAKELGLPARSTLHGRTPR